MKRLSLLLIDCLIMVFVGVSVCVGAVLLWVDDQLADLRAGR